MLEPRSVCKSIQAGFATMAQADLSTVLAQAQGVHVFSLKKIQVVPSCVVMQWTRPDLPNASKGWCCSEV